MSSNSICGYLRHLRFEETPLGRGPGGVPGGIVGGRGGGSGGGPGVGGCGGTGGIIGGRGTSAQSAIRAPSALSEVPRTMVVRGPPMAAFMRTD